MQKINYPKPLLACPGFSVFPSGKVPVSIHESRRGCKADGVEHEIFTNGTGTCVTWINRNPNGVRSSKLKSLWI